MKAAVVKYKFLFPVFTVFLIFSLILFFYTFYVDRDGNIKIASKLWSDFGSTFPIIRSFSEGVNFPPEYPIFSGSPIRYHFGFYFLVGLLEKIGLRIDFALNILSSLSFAALLTSIYLLSYHLFKKHFAAVIAVLLTIFNGSLGFVEYFKSNPISTDIFNQIVTNRNFSSFGPYDGKTVSAFWNLNIYTNQRHLAFAYASFILLLLFFHYSAKKAKGLSLNRAMLVGLFVGIFPFIHMAVFGMLIMLLGTTFLLYPKLRFKIIIATFVAATIAFPMIAYMGSPQVKTPFIHLGYLINDLNLKNFVTYWFANLGLNFFLPFIGFVLAKKDQRKIFIPFLLLFLIGNIFRFSPEIAANHKFINLYFIGSVIFSAYAIGKLWQVKIIGKVVVPIMLVVLTATGIIDFFPVFNDSHLEVTDIRNNDTAEYIQKNTRKDAIFVNTKFLYDPASISGRKIYLGWPYFSWSAGYDTDKRFKKLKSLLSSQDLNSLCKILRKEKIDYIELEDPSELANEGIIINYQLFQQNLKPVFVSEKSGISIYDTKAICSSI